MIQIAEKDDTIKTAENKDILKIVVKMMQLRLLNDTKKR